MPSKLRRAHDEIAHLTELQAGWDEEIRALRAKLIAQVNQVRVLGSGT